MHSWPFYWKFWMKSGNEFMLDRQIDDLDACWYILLRCNNQRFSKLQISFLKLDNKLKFKVYFIPVQSWNDSANISGFPHRFSFGFFGMESQNFAGYYSARMCLIKEKEIGEKWRGKWRWRRRKELEMLNRYRFESL